MNEAVSTGNSVFHRTEPGPFNAWNSSNLTYAEVVAGLRHQRQMALNLNGNKNLSIASRNYQLEGHQVEKSIEEKKIDKIHLKTDDKAGKNQMTEGMGKRKKPKKRVLQIQQGKSESVAHNTTLVENSPSEPNAVISEEFFNKSYAEVLKALKPGQMDRTTFNAHIALNKKESSNDECDKIINKAREPNMVPSQLPDQCVQINQLSKTENPLDQNQIITKHGNVSKKNKQKYKANIKSRKDVLRKPSSMKLAEKSRIDAIPNQQIFDDVPVIDNAQPSKDSLDKPAVQSKHDHKQGTSKDCDVKLSSETSETNRLSYCTNTISIVENNMNSESNMTDIVATSKTILLPKVQVDHMRADKNRSVKKYEKIRKSNSSKIAAMLNREKLQSEKELINAQSNVMTSLHEIPSENQTVDIIKPFFKHQEHATNIFECSQNTFKSNLIFDGHDFMNTPCEKSNDVLKADANKTKSLGVVNDENTSEGIKDVDPTFLKQNNNQQSSASFDYGNSSVSGVEDNDAKKSDINTIMDIRWHDNRQKISMITHEEYMLKPISFIKLELPKITADKFIDPSTLSATYDTHLETHIYQNESDVPVEETTHLDPSYSKESVVATEISMAKFSCSESSCSTSSTNSKHVLTPEKSFEDVEIPLEYSKNSDGQNTRVDATLKNQQFKTCLSSVSYKTSTILSEESGTRHDIAEHYFNPVKTNQASHDLSIYTQLSNTSSDSLQQKDFNIEKDFSLQENLLESTRKGCATDVIEESSINFGQIAHQIHSLSSISTEQTQLELEDVIAEEKFLIRSREQSLTRDEQIDAYSTKTVSPLGEDSKLERDPSPIEHLSTTEGGTQMEAIDISSMDIKHLDQMSDPTQGFSFISTVQKQVALEEEFPAQIVQMREQFLIKHDQVYESSFKISSPPQGDAKIEKDASSVEHLSTPSNEGTTIELMEVSITDIKQFDHSSDPMEGLASISTEQEQKELEEEISAEEKILIQMREQSLPRAVYEPPLKEDSASQEAVKNVRDTSPVEHLLTPSKEGTTMDAEEESSTDIKQLDQTSHPIEGLVSISTELEQNESEEEISAEDKILIQMREQSLTRDEQIDEPSLITISTDQEQNESEEEISAEEKILIRMREQSLTRDEQIDVPSLETVSHQKEDFIMERVTSSIEHFSTSIEEGTRKEVIEQLDQTSDPMEDLASISTEQEQKELEEEISAEEKIVIQTREQSQPRDVYEPPLKEGSPLQEAVKNVRDTSSVEHLLTPSKEGTTMDAEEESSTDIKQLDQTSHPTEGLASISTELEQNESEEISAEEKILVRMRELSLTRDEQIDVQSLKTISTEQEQNESEEEISAEEKILLQMREQSLTKDEQIDEPSLKTISTDQEQNESEEEISAEEKILIRMREQSLTRDEQIDAQSVKKISIEREQNASEEEISAEEKILLQMREQSLTRDEQIDESSLKTISTEQEQNESAEEISAEEKILIRMRDQSLTRDEQIDAPLLKTVSHQKEDFIMERGISSIEHFSSSIEEGTRKEVIEQLDQTSDPMEDLASISTEQEQKELEEEISAEEKIVIQTREQSQPRDMYEPSLKEGSPLQEAVKNVRDTSSVEHLLTPSKEGTTMDAEEESSTDIKQLDQTSHPTEGLASISTELEQNESEEISAEDEILVRMREQSLTRDEQIDAQSVKTISIEQEQNESEEEISAEEKILIRMREQSLTRDEQIDVPSLETVSHQKEDFIMEKGTSSIEHFSTSIEEGTRKEVIEQLDQTSDPMKELASISTEQEQKELEEEKIVIQMREQSQPRDLYEPPLKEDSPLQEAFKNVRDTSSVEHLLTPSKEGTTMDAEEESSTDIKQLDQTSHPIEGLVSISTELEQNESEEEISAEEKILIQMREQSLTKDEQIDEPSLETVSHQKEDFIMERGISSIQHFSSSIEKGTRKEVIEQLDQTSDPMKELASISTEQEQKELEEEISSEEKNLIQMREQSLPRDVYEPPLKEDSASQEADKNVRDTSPVEHLLTPSKEGTTMDAEEESSTNIKQLDQTSHPTEGLASISTELEQNESEEEISAEEKILIQMREQSLTKDEQIDAPSLKTVSHQKEDFKMESGISSIEHFSSSIEEGTRKEVIEQLDQTSDPMKELASISTKQEQKELEEEISSEEKIVIQMREQSQPRDVYEPPLKEDSPLQVAVKNVRDTSPVEHLLTPSKEGTTMDAGEESLTDVKQLDQTSHPIEALASISTEQEQNDSEEEISTEEKILIQMKDQSLTRDEQIDEPSLKTISTDQEQNESEEEISAEEKILIRMKEQSLTKDEQIDEPSLKTVSHQKEDFIMERGTSSIKHFSTSIEEGTRTEMIEQLDQTSDPMEDLASISTKQEQVEFENINSEQEVFLTQTREQSLKRDAQNAAPSLKDGAKIERNTSSIEHLSTPTKDGHTKMDVSSIDDQLSSPIQSILSISVEPEQVKLEEKVSAEEIMGLIPTHIFETKMNMEKYVSSEEYLRTHTRKGSIMEMMEDGTDINQIDQSSNPTQGVSTISTEQEHEQNAVNRTNSLYNENPETIYYNLMKDAEVKFKKLSENKDKINENVSFDMHHGTNKVLEVRDVQTKAELQKLKILEQQQLFSSVSNIEQSPSHSLLIDTHASKSKSINENKTSFTQNDNLNNTSVNSSMLNDIETAYVFKCLATENKFELLKLHDAEKQYFEQNDNEKISKSKALINFEKTVESQRKPDNIIVDKGNDCIDTVSQNLTQVRKIVHYSTETLLALNELCADQPEQSLIRGDLKNNMELSNQKSSIEINLDEHNPTKTYQSDAAEEMKEDRLYDIKVDTCKDQINVTIMESLTNERCPIVKEDLPSYSNNGDSSTNNSKHKFSDATTSNENNITELDHTNQFDINQLHSFTECWLNKSVYGKAECLYYTLKSKEDFIALNATVPNENFKDNAKNLIQKSTNILQETVHNMQPAVKDIDEINRQPKCAAKKLTIASSVLNIPIKHGITNSDDPETPKHPTEHHSIGSTTNEALNCFETNDPESKKSIQILPHCVENILESLLTEELKMNNLPYDNVNDLIKGLQVLIENLADYKQQNYAISMSLPPNADTKTQESIRQIDDRIDFLQQRAHDGLEKIQKTLKMRELRKKEVQSYMLLLEEIESWLSTSLIQLDDVDDNTSEDNVNQMLHRNLNLLCILTEKETKARAIHAKTDEFLMYSDVCDRATLLKENLGASIRTMREKSLILENNIQRLKLKLEPTASTMVSTEMQTSPPVSLEVFSRASVEQQDTSSQTHASGSTDNILIIQSVSNGQETVQISNVRNTPLMGTIDDIIVEAKYTHPQEGEGKKSSELLLQNIPSQFESTFVEPDDSTTEIVVDKDGSKKITLRKTIQSIESIGPCEISSTSTLDAEALPPVIEGTVFEVTTKLKSVSDDVDVARNIVGEILDDIQETVVTSVDNKESDLLDIQEQDSQVFESDALKVDLIAYVVDSPSTSTVFSLQSTSEPYSNLTENKDTELNASDVEHIGEIWPPIESIKTEVLGRISIANDASPVRANRSKMLKPDIVSAEIWPQSLNTGSNYIDIAPQLPPLPPSISDDSIKLNQEIHDDFNVTLLDQNDESKCVPKIENDSQSVSKICKEYPIEETKPKISSAIGIEGIEEKLQEEILGHENDEPPADNESVIETSIIQIKPPKTTADMNTEPSADHVFPEEVRDSMQFDESNEIECASKDITPDSIASPLIHVPLEEKRDLIEVIEPCENKSMDEAKALPPDHILFEEGRNIIPGVEPYEKESKGEDTIAKSEIYCEGTKEQLTHIQPTKCESDAKLEVKVASTKEEQSSLKITMNVVPLDAKKISVSLIEVGHADSKTIPIEDPSRIEERKLSKDLLTSEKIPGLSDIDYDKGYEPDKTTVDGESETDETQKKKKRKKKKPRNDTDKAINTELLESSVEASGAIATDARYEKLEIKATHEEIVNVTNETSSSIHEQIVVSTEVVEAVYVEDVQQQTTPVGFEHPDYGVDQEVSKITSERLIVPIDFEQKSMQTSPEPETLKMSHQTSPIQASTVVSEAKEIQTSIQVHEIETQTLSVTPKHHIEQESQTEMNNSEYMDKSAATSVIDVVDTANQTVTTNTSEIQIQTMEDFSEIVEPLVSNIIGLAINEEVTYQHHSIQTSPVSMEPSEENAVSLLHESVQTIKPDILDALVGTEQILREKATSPAPQETKSDVQIQTSPIRETDIILEKCDRPKTSLADHVNQDSQTILVTVVDNGAQTNPEPITSVSKVDISCSENSTLGKADSEKIKKKMKKRKSGTRTPLQVEVSAQIEVPDSSAEIDTLTVRKNIISQAKVDYENDFDIHVHLDIDPPPQHSESFRINELISDEKMVSLGLHNYLSILKSQQNYAEHKNVPWSEMASMLENLYRVGNSLQTQYPNALRTTLADDKDKDQVCDNLDLERVLCVLKENSTDAAMQNQILFEILEGISIPTEKIAADLNIIQNLSLTESLRVCQKYKMRIMCMLKLIKQITIFLTSNSTQLNPDVIKCFEQTANELRHLDNKVSSLEVEYQRKQDQTDSLYDTLHNLNAQFESIDEKLSLIICNETLSINDKLQQLDELDLQYLEYTKRLRSVSTELQILINTPIDRNVENLLVTAEKKSWKFSHSLIMERNKLKQLISLAEEYEQTLLEFQDITEAAECFIKNNIVTNSLEELQEEMQRYRKFFVNLNHCKMILESLEANLDTITRQKHADLHSFLYHKTASILEKAVDKAAKLAQAASKWTILQKEMRNESQWLQIAQQRVPDLRNVSSEDFEQFITLYESLFQDIVSHHAKMIQQNEVAKKMQDIISAPILEKESNEALTVIVQLREEVSLHMNLLLKFKLHWNNYNCSADKLGEWICSCKKILREIRIPPNLVDTPVADTRNFWEIKAQYEVLNNKVYKSACDSFDRALLIIDVSDEPLQRQLHGQLLENWLDVSATISQIQTNISESMKTDSTPVCDKISFIEQELQEIATLFNSTKGVLKSLEDLYAYVEKIQMLRMRIDLIDSELGQIALGADSNTEKISDIFEASRNVSQQINEEFEAAEIFYKLLEDIENGIKEEEINLSQVSNTLNLKNTNCKRPDVQKSLDECIQCQFMLSDSWNKIMKLRQMLHTLPMNLKVSVSPLQTERALSLLQTTHNDLEHRCESIIIQLRNRLSLWNKFNRQLEIIQEHIQETEFMMELMQLQENADYQRLLTATERLDALLIEIDSRKNTVEDLKSIAQPLIETSDESVSLEIQETVQKITVVWQNTRENLKELCQRYEKAVKLWQHYHDVCKNVKHWVEHEVSDSQTLEYMNEISQLEIYQSLISDKKKDLAQLKDLINNINVQVGFNVTGPLMMEIEDFSHKIDEIEENVVSHKSNIESKNHQYNENQIVLSQAQQLFVKLQQSSRDTDFSSDLEIKIKQLREYMINLSATESRLEDILNGKQSEALAHNEVKNLHLISKSLMQDSLEQYQSLINKILLHGSDDQFINFWDTYMMFVKNFLEQDIPYDDTELRKLRSQYSLVAYLLKDFEATTLKKSCLNISHASKYNCLNQQHSEHIATIENQLIEIETRLQHWDKYYNIKSSLKECMSFIEREKYGLQFEYISVKEISKMKNKVNALQETFPHIEQDLNIMQREISEILIFTKDEHTMIQIQSNHGKLIQQASKLKESIETWIDFLSRIENLHEHFHSQCDQIQLNLVELNQCLEEVKIDSLGASQHHLNMLKNEQLRLAGIKETLTRTNEIRDELKQRISIFDAKLIHQRLWQLWQMFEKLDYSLSVLLKQMQERLQNLKLFSQQYTILTNWLMEFEKRINDSNKYQTCEDDATFIKSVEELLLQELLLKENEIEWFNIIGSDLVNNLQKGEEQLEIQSKLDILNLNWKNLKNHCHNRTQKIQEVNNTTISLQHRIEDIKAWMKKIEHELKSPFLFESLDDSVLNKLMDQYDNLQRSIESNSGNLGEVLNLCEMLFTDVESWNVHIDRKHVLHDINSLELRWKNICLQSTKHKQDLLSIWNMLLEIEKIINSHQEWVEKCNRYLDTLENLCQSPVNIENVGEILEELAIRNSDMIAQEPVSHILRKLFVSLHKHERVDAANIRKVTNRAMKILSIWECLLWRSNKLKTELNDLNTKHTIFVNEYENIIMALTQIDVQVVNIKHLSRSSDDTPETKRKQLRNLHNELRFVINLFDKQDELGSILMEKVSLPNNIHLKIQEYHDFANNIKMSLDSLLLESIQESDKQKCQLSSQVQTESYEKDSAVQVNTLPALSHGKSITAKEAYQYQLESALVEARGHLESLQTAINEINVNNFMTSTQKVSKLSATCESSIELLKHLNLMILSGAQSNDEDTLSKLVSIECDKFTQYQTEWRTKQQKLEELSNEDYLTCPLCTNRNWQQIDNDLWRLEQWLQMAEANQKNQQTHPPTDIDTLEDTIQDHREFLLDLDSHKSIIKSLNIVGEHLATHTLDTEKAVRLRERLQADNQRWEKVCSQASHWQSQLHHALMSNKEFHRTVTELCIWLEQTETKIKNSEPIDLTSDMKLIERKYKTFRELRSDLVRCEPRVVSLQETTSQLTKYLEANKSQQFDEIYAKLTDLRLRFHSIRRLVEMYTIKIAAALGYDPTFETSSTASVDTQQEIQGVSGSLTRVAGRESNANVQEAEDEEHINTTVLTRSYRFLGRVVRASLPIQAMLLLLLGVVTLMPHGEDYSCTLTNNFARSLEPMLRYPNGPPPI